MIYASLKAASVGVGEDSLKGALMQLRQQRPRIVFSNVSRNNDVEDCETLYWWDHVHRSVPEDILPPHYFACGTAMHDGAEVLLNFKAQGKTSGVTAALEAVWDSIHESWPNGERGPREQEHYDALLKYAPDVLEAAARRFEQIDDVFATEQLVWALVPVQHMSSALENPRLSNMWVCVMGRVDAIVSMHGLVWHLQHKTTSKRGDYESYVTALGFSGHETVYGWIISELLRTGQLRAEGYDYGGSIIHMMQKRARPDSAVKDLPKGLTDLVDKGKVEIIMGEEGPEQVVNTGTATEKQFESATKLFDNWLAGEEKRKAELMDYEESVSEFLQADLDAEKIEIGMRRVVRSIWTKQREVEMIRPSELFADPLLLSQNHQRCVDQAGRPCPRLESKTCGGWEDYNYMDPDSGWTIKPMDYVNEIRNFWETIDVQ